MFCSEHNFRDMMTNKNWIAYFINKDKEKRDVGMKKKIVRIKTKT